MFNYDSYYMAGKINSFSLLSKLHFLFCSKKKPLQMKGFGNYNTRSVEIKPGLPDRQNSLALPGFQNAQVP